MVAGCKEKLLLLDSVMDANVSDFVLAFTMLGTPSESPHKWSLLASNRDFLSKIEGNKQLTKIELLC